MRKAYLSYLPSCVVVALGTSASSQSFAANVDPTQVCLAAADTGQSLRDEGKYAIAHKQFLTCSADACPKLVHDQCADWLRKLDEATPTVVFGAKDAEGHDVRDVRVLLDGRLITSVLDGTPTPLDPGPHDIHFERTSNVTFDVHVVLRAGEKRRDVMATFASIPSAPEAEPTGASSASFWNARTVTSGSLLVGGAIAIGVGVVFGLQSQGENSDADTVRRKLPRDACPNPSASATCQRLSDLVDAQNRDAVLNQALFITGAALAAGAVATWLLLPKRREDQSSATWVAPIVGPAHAGIGVGGAF